MDWEDQENEEDFTPLPQEHVGRNEARKRGYSRLSPASSEAYKSGKQTLFINAAIGNHGDKPHQAPWLVELDLPASTIVSSTQKEEGHHTEAGNSLLFDSNLTSVQNSISEMEDDDFPVKKRLRIARK